MTKFFVSLYLQKMCFFIQKKLEDAKKEIESHIKDKDAQVRLSPTTCKKTMHSETLLIKAK